jgi:hypothetical protein
MAVKDELERKWKELVVTHFKLIFQHFLEILGRPRKISMRVSGLRTEIRIPDLQNTK